MQSKHYGVVLGTIAAASCLVGGGLGSQARWTPSAQAQETGGEEQHDTCNVATLSGGYGFTFQGFGTRAPVPALIGAFIPAAGVGLVNFNGRGGLTLSETVSSGGSIAPLATTGIYSVNSDCTGSLDAPGAATWNFVVVHEGKQIMAINTTPGRVAPVFLEKQ